jgi:hypothetical protein
MVAARFGQAEIEVFGKFFCDTRHIYPVSCITLSTFPACRFDFRSSLRYPPLIRAIRTLLSPTMKRVETPVFRGVILVTLSGAQLPENWLRDY